MQHHYLGVAGKLCHLAFSHGDHYSFPHSQLELLPQDELHRFTATPHGPGVIQHCAITEAAAVVENHLMRQTDWSGTAAVITGNIRATDCIFTANN